MHVQMGQGCEGHWMAVRLRLLAEFKQGGENHTQVGKKKSDGPCCHCSCGCAASPS